MIWDSLVILFPLMFEFANDDFPGERLVACRNRATQHRAGDGVHEPVFHPTHRGGRDMNSGYPDTPAITLYDPLADLLEAGDGRFT